MSRREVGAHTYIYSANPFRFLVGTKCSPFSPYRRLFTGCRTGKTGYFQCRPNKDQSDGEDASDLHTSGARERVDVGQKFPAIYCLTVLTQREGDGRHSEVSRANASDHRGDAVVQILSRVLGTK